MSETRMITVKGDASIFKVSDGSPPGAKQTRRRPRPISGGMPTVFVKMGAGEQATTAVQSATQPSSAPAITNASATLPSADAAGSTPATNSTAPQKVVLGSKKPKAMKVLLTKKNHGPTDPPNSTSSNGPSGGGKKHRKVTLGIQHLKRRVTKARRLNKMTKTLSIDQIKKELIAAKIIKEDSKAPEAILRQMYADAKLITTKSL